MDLRRMQRGARRHEAGDPCASSTSWILAADKAHGICGKSPAKEADASQLRALSRLFSHNDSWECWQAPHTAPHWGTRLTAGTRTLLDNAHTPVRPSPQEVTSQPEQSQVARNRTAPSPCTEPRKRAPCVFSKSPHPVRGHGQSDVAQKKPQPEGGRED